MERLDAWLHDPGPDESGRGRRSSCGWPGVIAGTTGRMYGRRWMEYHAEAAPRPLGTGCCGPDETTKRARNDCGLWMGAQASRPGPDESGGHRRGLGAGADTANEDA